MKTAVPSGFLKIVLSGDFGVGKSSLIRRYVENKFDEEPPTIDDDIFSKDVVIDGEAIPVKIHDTAGQERFKTVTSSFFNGAHGVMYVFDPHDKETFSSMKHWTDEVSRYAGKDVSQLVVANKTDIEGEWDVPADEVEKCCEGLTNTSNKNFPVVSVKTSAKDGSGVDEAFVSLVKTILNRLKAEKPKVSKADVLSNISDDVPEPKGKPAKRRGCQIV